MNKIKNIYWERVNLHLVFEEEVSGQVYLLDKKASKHLLLYKGNDVVINVTNVTNGDMIEAGEFTLYIDDNKVYVSDELIAELDDLSRFFKYKSNQYALLIELCINEDKSFYFNSDYMMKNRKYKKLSRFEQNKNFFDVIKYVSEKILVFGIGFLYRILRVFKMKRKNPVVLFFSEDNAEPAGNLAKLYEYFKTIDNVIVKGCFFDRYGLKGAFEIIKAVAFISFSDIIVLDNYALTLNLFELSPKQRVVQLWHAGVGFKSIGYPRFGKKGGPHPFKSSHRKYDLAIVDDERLIDIYSEVFARPASIFKPLGMPRLENYLAKSTINEKTEYLYKKNNDLKIKKVILFSPTFRGVTADEAYYDYNVLNLSEIYKFCKDNCFVFVIKMHPFIKEKISIPEEFKSCILDYSDFDINDLIYIADIMITDYSSCAYEFSFFNRPLVFFRYDKEVYEYLRPVHTLDVFTKQQYEVKNFDELMNVCESLKSVSIENRFSDVVKRKDLCCEDISREILGLVQ